MLRRRNMSDPHVVGCYDYVKRPFDGVRALLRREPLELIQRATTSATVRGRSLAISLHVDVAGIALGVDVRLHIRRIYDEMLSGVLPALRVELAWEAIEHPALFPTMLADILVWPLSARETQVEVQGSYWHPLGRLGDALDAAVGHSIAQATVHRFLGDLLEELRRELPEPAWEGTADRVFVR
jgi:hypothetical protein